MGRYIDLHVHSIISDGEYSVDELINYAMSSDMSAIAITDHNSFALYEPVNIEESGLEIIPGCEFSCIYKNEKGEKEVHIIGLFFNGIPDYFRNYYDDSKYVYLNKLLEKCNDAGMDIRLEDVQKMYPDSRRIGRSQLAKFMVCAGYAANVDEAMDRYIGNRSPYYISPCSIEGIGYRSMDETIKDMVSAGGFPILAHPYHYHFNDEQVENLVRTFADSVGLAGSGGGIEVYYSKYGDDQVEKLEKLAEKYDLYPSAASDLHKKKHKFVKGKEILLEKIKT